MGYYANVKSAELKITDKEGLLSFLRREFPINGEWVTEEEELFDRLAYCLPVTELRNINEDGTLDIYSDGYFTSQMWWRDFTPYLEGYVEWQGEDGEIWCDFFDGRSMDTEIC